jgi:very-short-patch-repair endonuclease
LIVEVDGAHHLRRGAADARRDAVLGRLGYRVLRIQSRLVMRDLSAVVCAVLNALA